MRLMNCILLALFCLSASAFAEPKSIEVISHSIVTDTIEDAVSPSGLVRTKNGDYLVTFANAGDVDVGCTAFLCRSTDGGKSWSAPERVWKPSKDTEGVACNLHNLPDGNILLVIERITYKSNKPRKETRSFNHFIGRYSTLELQLCTDADGKEFKHLCFLDNVNNALCANSSIVVEFPNGDWVLPGYATSHTRPKPNATDGSGYWRSKDKGKSWGKFEVAFDAYTKKEDKYIVFTENAFFVKADGTIVAYARQDSSSYSECYAYRIESKDNGESWSKPEETNLVINYFSFLKHSDGSTLLLAGDRKSVPSTRHVTIFSSADGESFQALGKVYCSRGKPGGYPFNAATGGCQRFVPMEEPNRYLIVFYSFDKTLPGFFQTYIDSNIVEVK
ncbi:MAG: exo-alpha-sialidase [Oligosphaeraceae bacterium]|nr:exo-alpha-sialidase [Oligosphaeraceae bacterium]